ncbi:MAG: hypothetical protein ROO76_03395 [Terriglobia bacterium]|nr:hypothetical protein [Terriglobia bacterium]
MGRQQLHDTTIEYVALDVRWLRRQGYLRPGWSGSVNWSRGGERFAFIYLSASPDAVTLRYKTRRGLGEWQEKRYPVAVEWVPCRYGGKRAWFRCPACGRCAAILYGAGVFACRQCLHLTYPCQREVLHYRALRKAQDIHEKLGGTGIIDDPLFKPKGMHWRTYYRHLQRFQEAESRAVPPWLLKLL